MPVNAYIFTDIDTGRTSMAFIAGDGDAEYIGRPDDAEAVKEANAQLATALEFFEEPAELDGWTEIVNARHSQSDVLGPYDFDSAAEAGEWVMTVLEEDPTPGADSAPDARSFAAAQAWDELSADFPEWAAEMDDEAPDEESERVPGEPDPMAIWMIQAHGPIDPEGPNAWLLAAAEGEEVPEDAYISFRPPASPSATSAEEIE